MNGRRENVCVGKLHDVATFPRILLTKLNRCWSQWYKRATGQARRRTFDSGRSRWIVEQGHIGCTRTLVSVYANNQLLVRPRRKAHKENLIPC